MSREVTVEKVSIADLQVFQEVCEKNGLRWEVMQSRDIVARVYDENSGGPTYRRHMDVIKKENSQTYGLRTDNDQLYSSITARFGQDGGTLVRDYCAAALAKKYRRMGGLIQSQKVLTGQLNGWIELKVAVGGM